MKLYNTGNGKVEEHTAESLTSNAVAGSAGYYAGQVEALQSRVEKLTEIVGKLVARLPEKEWLEVTTARYQYEKVD